MRQLFLDGGSLDGRRAGAQAVRGPAPGRERVRRRPVPAQLLVPHHRLQGHAVGPAAGGYYPDLADERLASALAIVHSRFSTNTFPSWALAHPFHMSAHNGEFNTLLGNVSWMRAREAHLAAGPLGDDVARTLPAIPAGSSDSAAFDAVLELLVRGGRSLPHSVMLMTPEAHEGRPDMPEALSDFYDYGSMLMEPWDGPASVTFTDGKILGATLDRNGLRPGRWVVTRDGWFALASEAGAFHVPSEDVERVGPAAARPAGGGRPRARRPAGGPPGRAGRGRRPPLRRLVRRALAGHRRPARGPPAGAPRGPARAAPAGLRLDPGGRARRAGPDGRRRRGRGLDGQRRGAGRASPSASRRCSPTSSSCSRR